MRRLAKSVQLGGLIGRVDVLHNAVATETGVRVDLIINLKNRGGTKTVRSAFSKNVGCSSGDFTNNETEECRASAATTVTLDDLLPLVQDVANRVTAASPERQPADQRRLNPRPWVIVKVYCGTTVTASEVDLSQLDQHCRLRAYVTCYSLIIETWLI